MTALANRFESIEEAQEYVRLLREVVEETRDFVDRELADAADGPRHADALRLVLYKLSQLRDHLRASSRLLNDLRTLRRMLYTAQESDALSPASSREASGIAYARGASR